LIASIVGDAGRADGRRRRSHRRDLGGYSAIIPLTNPPLTLGFSRAGEQMVTQSVKRIVAQRVTREENSYLGMVPPPGIEPGRAIAAHQRPRLARLPKFPARGHCEGGRGGTRTPILPVSSRMLTACRASSSATRPNSHPGVWPGLANSSLDRARPDQRPSTRFVGRDSIYPSGVIWGVDFLCW
jgi:hypothetical protein